MTILFVGSEDIDFTNFVSVATSASLSDPNYSRKAVWSEQSASVGGMLPFAELPALTESWLHCYSGPWTASGTTVNFFMAMGSVSNPRKIGCKKSLQGGNGQLFADNGNGTILTGTAFLFPKDTGDFDLHVKITGTNALVEIYQDGVLIKADNFTLVTPYTLDIFELAGGGTTTLWLHRFSQVVYATVPTIGWKVFTRPPTGNGGETSFAGGYTEVDDETLSVDDMITANIAAKETFTRAALTVPTGMEVKAVAISGYARTGLPELDDFYLLLRKGGTNYRSDLKTLTPGFKRQAAVWETDPATSLKFTNSDVESATAFEFGVETL